MKRSLSLQNSSNNAANNCRSSGLSAGRAVPSAYSKTATMTPIKRQSLGCNNCSVCRRSPMYMLNAWGDSTAPSCTPSVSLNGLLTSRLMQTMLQVLSRMASIILQRPKLTPHWHIFLINIGRLSEGNAVLKSSHNMYKRFRSVVRDRISAMSKVTASLQPVSL